MDALIETVLTPVLERVWRRYHLASREVTSLDQLFDRYFRSAGVPHDQFVDAWNLIASTLHVDGRKLHPEDPLEQMRGIAAHVSIFSDLDSIYELPGVRELYTRNEELTLSDVVKLLISVGHLKNHSNGKPTDAGPF